MAEKVNSHCSVRFIFSTFDLLCLVQKIFISFYLSLVFFMLNIFVCLRICFRGGDRELVSQECSGTVIIISFMILSC